MDEIGSQRSERKNTGQVSKKEGLRHKISNWWQNGKNGDAKMQQTEPNKQKSSTKTLYKPTIMSK